MSFPRGAKPVARRAALSRRDALSEAERGAASSRIVERAGAILAAAVAPGQVVALYASKGSEVDTAELDGFARGRGLRVVYPRVVAHERRLAFHEVPATQLVSSRLGLREPPADAPRVAIEAIAAFVVPGVAFDRAGGRVGWGRGHYDATLAAAAAGALRIGLGFECQLVERVPHDPHDALLHHVVTEAAAYRTPD